jgi:predicted aspartyl protease
VPAYDSTWFAPPAPLARVTLRSQGTGTTWQDVPMLLDTGADVSLVPGAVLERLALAPVPDRRYELLGFDGSSSFAEIVQLDLIFLGRRFSGQFLLSQQEWGIIGRNILNAVSLRFDGPQLAWDEYREK